MKVMGKTLYEYFLASKKFLAIIIVLMIIIVVLRLRSYYPAGVQTPLFILGGIVFIWAGWSVVRYHEFNLKQAGCVGLILSFGIHWTLPIFHHGWEVFYLILINTIIYSVIVIFGGWLAKFKKSSN